MTGNKYEKYVVRQAMRPESFLDPMVADLMTMPPLIFLNRDNPVQVSNQFLDVVWIWNEGAAAINPDRPPHSHEFDEIFIFLGINREIPNDLGGEVEFLLGEGEDTEKYLLNTSTCIFVPRGLVYLPMIFKKVKQPFLLVTVGVNMGKEWVRDKSPRE